MTGDKQLTINIRALTGELTSGLQKATAETRAWGASTQTTIAQVEQSTERISRLWRSAFEAFLGFEAVNMLKNIALGADRVATQLDVAARVARNFGNALDPAKMEAWLQAFARSPKGGGFPIDEMRKAVELFASLGEGPAQIQRAIADTAELAAAKEMDFGEAANIVRMALTGHVEMLTRYGVISREAAKNIHTVNDAMNALEKGTAGAAEERSNKLVADFGRLSSAASDLSNQLGKALEPAFEAVSNVLTNFADALSKIPAPVMQVAGDILAFGTALVTVTLILPAIAKGIEIVREGMLLLAVVTVPLQKLAATFGLLETGVEGFTAAELGMIAPVAAIVAAIAGVIVVLVELHDHMDHVKTAWHDWTQYLSDSFHEFVQNFEQDNEVLVKTMNAIAKLAIDTATYQVGKWKGDIASIVMTVAPRTTIKDAPTLNRDDSAIGSDIVNKWKGLADQLIAFFTGLVKSSLGHNPDVPHPKFPGIIPGKGGSGGADKAAENALKNFEEATKNWLAGFVAKVDAAKAEVDIASEKLADFDVKHPANVPMTGADQAARKALVAEELEKQRSLQAAIAQNQRAELAAAQQYLDVAKAIPTALKNHDALVRQARDAAREHAKAAQELYLHYLRAGTALDTLVAKERDAANTRVDAARDAANDDAERALAQKNLERDIRGEQAGQQLAIDKARGRAGPAITLEEDHLKIALDQLAVAAAADTEQMKQQELARARLAYDQTGSIDDLNKLKDAQIALTQATLNAIRAEDQRAADIAKLTADQQAQWTQLIDDLISKAHAPGLTANAGEVSFSPLEFLLAAFEQTRSFADVMTTVTQIMQTFARAMDALKPIIDALLDVVRAVVNVFIFLYNGVARILDLFGMQIQQLQYLNAAIGELVPLIEVWHMIPTLNELAAGKLNSPLSTQPQGLQTVGGPGQGQNELMKIAEVLTAVFAAMVAMKVVAGQGLVQAISQVLHLNLLGVGQNKQDVVNTSLSGQEKINAQQVGAKSDAFAQNIGVAAAGLTRTSNTLLNSIWTTLQQILLAIQEQATVDAGGSGGIGGILGALFGGGASLGAAGIAVLGPSGGIGQAVAALKSGADSFRAALLSGVSAINEHAYALRGASQEVRDFQSAIAAARSEMRSNGGVAGLSHALALDMSRRIAVSTNGIDRVPGM